MKIAFVGKGGSGKSTMTSLFIRYLQQTKQDVLAIDADINMNLAGLLDVDVDMAHCLANPEVADKIRTYLKGENARIADISKFLPTTPPANGANIVRHVADETLAPFASRVSIVPDVRLLTVGTYDKEGIGQTCYHSHLFVAENLLSHISLDKNAWTVCDMVAGTDAFAYSLHLQFDAIILIAEPTPESAEVCALYMDLARQAGIEGLVHVVGNKIDDEDDRAYIEERTGCSLLGYLPIMKTLKKTRQRGEPVTLEMVDDDVAALMKTIENKAKMPPVSPQQRLEKLYDLHETLNQKQWVKDACGDVMNQIDRTFDPRFINQNKQEKAA
jgi:CO dehydrogenase maturation factor